MKVLWYSVFSFLFSCLEPTIRKYIWMRTTSISVMVIFWKCHPESYLFTAMFEVPSQQLWGTLSTAFRKTPYNWRFYGHGWTYLTILSSKLEKTSWNENQRSCLKSYKLHKNLNLHFEQHCTKIDLISLIFIRFFFSQSNLVFKFNLCLLVYWTIFAKIYFSVCLLIIICYFTNLKVHSVPLFIIS